MDHAEQSLFAIYLFYSDLTSIRYVLFDRAMIQR